MLPFFLFILQYFLRAYIHYLFILHAENSHGMRSISWVFSGVPRRDLNSGQGCLTASRRDIVWATTHPWFYELILHLLVLRSNNISFFQESCQYTNICISPLHQPFSSPKRRHWHTRILNQPAVCDLNCAWCMFDNKYYVYSQQLELTVACSWPAFLNANGTGRFHRNTYYGCFPPPPPPALSSSKLGKTAIRPSHLAIVSPVWQHGFPRVQ